MPATHGQSYDLLRLTVTGQGALGEVQAFLAGIESAAARHIRYWSELGSSRRMHSRPRLAAAKGK